MYIYWWGCIELMYFLWMFSCSAFLYKVYGVRVFCIWQRHITFLTLHYHTTEGTVNRMLWSIKPLPKYNPWLVSEILWAWKKKAPKTATFKVCCCGQDANPDSKAFCLSNGYQATKSAHHRPVHPCIKSGKLRQIFVCMREMWNSVHRDRCGVVCE